MMMITVMGPGEACADPEKYLKSISGDALSEFGMPQSESIIIKPDYLLLASLAGILIFATVVVMLLISYCLHK